jgi:SPRY domain
VRKKKKKKKVRMFAQRTHVSDVNKKLDNLKELYTRGLIQLADYQSRKRAIVDVNQSEHDENENVNKNKRQRNKSEPEPESESTAASSSSSHACSSSDASPSLMSMIQVPVKFDVRSIDDTEMLQIEDDGVTLRRRKRVGVNTRDERWTSAVVAGQSMDGVRTATFRVVRTEQSLVMLGVAVRSKHFPLGAFAGSLDGTYALFLANGGAWHAGQRSRYARVALKSGAVVGVRVDRARRTVSYLIDGIDMGVAHQLEANDNGDQLDFIVSMRTPGDVVHLISRD